MDRLCAVNKLTRGEILTVAQVWELSKLWYHNRMMLEYHGRTVVEVEAIFKQLGLTSSFWYMELQ
ncbi:MAG: hypothetical protein HY868_04310 [Chloroflexi bacterium]|nr:hypothetical protein [Chloroflexota bacterium]